MNNLIDKSFVATSSQIQRVFKGLYHSKFKIGTNDFRKFQLIINSFMGDPQHKHLLRVIGIDNPIVLEYYSSHEISMEEVYLTIINNKNLVIGNVNVTICGKEYLKMIYDRP